MTVVEALQATKGILVNICVPIAYKEPIADPIMVAVKNIDEIIKAHQAAEAPEEKPEDNKPAVTEDQL